MDKASKRLLIFIVAYNAQGALPDVLERIPPAIYEYDYEVLIIDDSSADRTFEQGVAYKLAHADRRIKVLYNPQNQGYGGNQKLGYQYAIDHGFDAVALLHGDGQYAPEMLEELSRPVLEGRAQAVFGTRMAQPGQARRGGMPLYKLAGNRILTWMQNRLLGANLTEFHSGYRVYSTAALAQIPFHCNTNDFHFDTEIIIQFLRKGFSIREIPIPTYYGDEICHVNGLRYAYDVIRVTLGSVLHAKGLMYERKFDLEPQADVYDLKLGYTSSHTLALEAIPAGARVLDLGCGRGLLAAEVKKKGCHVHGVDKHAAAPECGLDGFTLHDLEQGEPPVPLEDFDYVLLLDIIEHLSSPEEFLDRLRAQGGVKKPFVIITAPNVAFIVTRLRLFMGGFQYGKQGILDHTHRRLFTFGSLKNMLDQCGYQALEIKGTPAPFPKALGDNLLSRLLLAVNSLLIHVSRGLFSYQVYVKARPLPTVADLLELARRTSRLKAAEVSDNLARSGG